MAHDGLRHLLAAHEPIRRVDARQGPGERFGCHHRGFERFEHRAAERLEVARAVRATGAGFDMRGHHQRAAVVQRAGRMREQQFVVGMVMDHDSEASSNRRRWFTASRMRSAYHCYKNGKKGGPVVVSYQPFLFRPDSHGD